MITRECYNRFISLLLSGDRESCINIVNSLLENEIDMRDLYTHLFHEAMYEIGTLWENNKITVAVEHLATAIMENLLCLVYPQLFSDRSKRVGKKAVISCTVNEYHQIGAKMIADIFELNGWDSYFLGANTPIEGLLTLIHEKKPQVVGLSVSIYSNMEKLIQTIERIKAEFPQKDILVG